MKITNKYQFEAVLKGIYPNVIKELKFVPNRQFAADFYIEELNCLIEWEGIICKKSGHTTIKGYSSNCEKYNFASKLGYKLLRYTVKNCNNIAADLEYLKKNP